MKNSPLVVAGIIFTVVGIIHLLRIIYDWQIIIAGYVIPMYVSIIGLIVAMILAIWMFSSAIKN